MLDRLPPTGHGMGQEPSAGRSGVGIIGIVSGIRIPVVWLELNADGTVTDYNCWQEVGQDRTQVLWLMLARLWNNRLKTNRSDW